MLIKLLRLQLVGLVILLGFILQTRFVLAIGISPVNIEIDHILPNSSTATAVYLSRGDASNEIIGRVIITGEAAQYVSAPLGETFTWPAGESSFTYPLVIEPGSLAAGTYTTAVLATSDPIPELDTATDATEATQTGTIIVTGAQANLAFTVTNETIESYSIQSVEMQATEEKQVAGFSYIMANTGNVDTRPHSIDITLTDELDPSHIYTETITAKQLPLVKAASEETVTVSTSLQPTAALYNVKITFYDKAGAVVYETTDIRLQVFPPGTLDQKGVLKSFTADKPTYQVGEVTLLQAEFENTGNVGTDATFITEILKDDVRIDLLKQEAVFVPYNQTVRLEASFKPTAGGSYQAVGYVNFGIFTTDQLTADFTVGDVGLGVVIAFLTGGTIILGLLIWLLHCRSQKKKLSTPNQ